MEDSAAYVVLRSYGIDTGDCSSPYVARWAQDRSVLTNNLNAIYRVGGTIIEGIAEQKQITRNDPRTTGPDRG